MKTSVVLLVVMLLCSCQATPSGVMGTVTRITSGQTIEVRIGSQTQKIGLVGVEAPDYRQQPWATQAKQRLQALISGKTVQLEFAAPESSDYRLAAVWLDRTLVNETLIQEGMVLARSQSQSLYRDRFSNAQEQARLLRLGIWNPAEPLRQTPSEFRAQQ